MAYNGLQSFIKDLKSTDEIIEINQLVDPVLEITEITDRISKEQNGGKALLFKNNGSHFPLLINAFGSESRVLRSLNVSDSDEFFRRITKLFDSFKEQPDNWFEKLKMLPRLVGLSKIMPKKVSKRGVCQDVVNMQPDLDLLPILKCWPFDGGSFLTLPVVHTVDPDTGIGNIGMYRMQKLSKTTTGMHWHRHKVGARHFEAYKRKGLRMPVSVVLGGDPVYTYAATAPMPDHFDEYILAGFIRNKSVELVKCITNDLYVPSDADIVIEGYIDTTEDFIYEGPFGDHTGFYSLADYYPKFNVTCITHRKGAVYPATIVGVPPMEDAYLGLISEKLFLKPLQIGIAPEVADMHMPVAGVVHNLVVVSAQITYPGQAFKIANALWGAGQMMFTKYIVVVNDDVDIRDYIAVWNHVVQNVLPSKDLLCSKGPLDILDHASDIQAIGGKLAIDATRKTNISTHELDLSCLPSIHAQELMPGLWVVYTDDYNLDVLTINEYLDSGMSGWVVFVESELKEMNSYTLAWYVLGNTDAGRDVILNKEVVLVDGLRKFGRNGFDRAWPDLVVMNDAVIAKIDSIWSDLNIGGFVDSPSKFLKKIARESGAEL